MTGAIPLLPPAWCGQRQPYLNPLTPNDLYMSCTAPLTSKRCILYISSTNVGTEYFKHALYSPFFPSKCSLFHNANFFGSCIIHILYRGCAEIKKNTFYIFNTHQPAALSRLLLQKTFKNVPAIYTASKVHHHVHKWSHFKPKLH